MELKDIEKLYTKSPEDVYLFLIILQDFLRLTILNNPEKQNITTISELIEEYHNFIKRKEKKT